MEDTVTTNVIKRNGEEVHFDRAKIVNAITKANGNVERIHQTRTRLKRLQIRSPSRCRRCRTR